MFVWSSVAFAALPSTPCATLALLPSAPVLRTESVRTEPDRAARAGKGSRDVFGLPNVLESENFAVRWGDSGGVTEAAVARLSDAAERAWAVQVETMGHPEPFGTDDYRFNIYVGDSGDGAPVGYGVSGYYYVDTEGWPMVVVNTVTLGHPDYVDMTMAHELYHAIQATTARYPYTDPSAWYWEATASWAANETNPTNPANGDYLFGYLLLPELPVNFFENFDAGALQEYHQYGAWLFEYDLTRTVGWELVRDSWLDRTSERDPLEVQRTWLAERGLDLDELWLDHLAHNAVFDYPQGELYAVTLGQIGRLHPGHDRVAATVEGAGGEGVVTGEEGPRRYGANTFALTAPDSGTLRVEIDGETLGTRGSAAQLGARIVRVFDQGARIEYLSVPFEGTHGALDIEDVGEEDTIWLTVGAWTEPWDPELWYDETFDFGWKLAVFHPSEPVEDTGEPVVGSDGPEPAGCGCGGSAQAGAATVWVSVLLVQLRASRRRARGAHPLERPSVHGPLAGPTGGGIDVRPARRV